MSAKTEMKSSGTGETTAEAASMTEQTNRADAAQTAAQGETKPARKTEATETPEKFKATLQRLDGERTALAKNAIEQLKPGRPFDPAVVRQINKIETQKNRLIVSRFASLLRKSGPEVQAIVHQIIEL